MVEDFEQAEQAVRAAVKGTRYENIREISRMELSEADHQGMDAAAPSIQPMNFFETIGVLLFRRLPKRFRDLS